MQKSKSVIYYITGKEVKLEGLGVYERSKEELEKIKKSIATDEINITMSNLDGNTRLALTQAIDRVIKQRYPEVMSVITGVK
jgi:hypothetical protein